VKLKKKILGALSAGALMAGGLVVIASQSAYALTTISVSTNADAGAGSLRQAFIDASSGGSAAGDDVEIDIPASVGTITLSTGELLYDGGNGGSHTLTLRGNGNTIRQTTANARVINDTARTLFTMDGLTITGGTTTGSEAGAGIRVEGAATITNSTISGNNSGEAAGGLRVSNGALILTNSTISGNTAIGSDGGAFVNGPATIRNSTISGNDAGAGTGGGIEVNGAVSLVYATLSGNSAASGANVRVKEAGITSFGSVIALPQGDGTNCSSDVATVTNGFNWDDDGSCGFGSGTGDHSDAGNPQLGALGANGGPTQTRLPQTGSPLIDAIPAGSCQADGASGITTDQRGITRPQQAGCDIGAVEVVVEAAPAAKPVVVAPTLTG
jgi:hypothetical protein